MGKKRQLTILHEEFEIGKNSLLTAALRVTTGE